MPLVAGVESRVCAEPEDRRRLNEIFGCAAEAGKEVMIVGVDGRQASPRWEATKIA